MSQAADSELNAGGFRKRTVLIALGIAAAAAALFSVLSLYAPDLRVDMSGQAHVLSRSAVGYSGIAALLSDQGVTVHVSRNRPGTGRTLGQQYPGSAPLFILTPSFDTSRADIEAFFNQAAPVLIVPPKWTVIPDPNHPGWVTRALNFNRDGWGPVRGLSDTQTSIDRTSPTALILSGPAPGDNDVVDLSSLHLATGPLEEVRFCTSLKASRAGLVDEKGRPLLLVLPGKDVYILCDPDILNNKGLHDLRTAKTALSLINALRGGGGDRAGGVVFDVTLNGMTRSKNLFKLALEPPFLGATAALAIGALLLAWFSINLFRPVVRPERALPLGKAALVDNAAGLIALAGRTPAMAPRYLALIRRETALSVGLPDGLDTTAQRTRLDKMTDPSSQTRPFSQLAEQALKVREKSTLVASARDLHQWRQNLTNRSIKEPPRDA